MQTLKIHTSLQSLHLSVCFTKSTYVHHGRKGVLSLMEGRGCCPSWKEGGVVHHGRKGVLSIKEGGVVHHGRKGVLSLIVMCVPLHIITKSQKDYMY